MIQLALLLLLGLHNVGLFHHHATADEQGSCVACQFSDHQALDIPDPAAALPAALLVALCLVLFRPVPAIRRATLFDRPRSRAPPASLAS